ncbi:6-phosphofructokinase [Oleiharenicola lentus]|uniref:6-phosphofructokinase n=1 Tax=Oleiharenicola lentus TaxID=2508720 RepID=UPI003F660F87
MAEELVGNCLISQSGGPTAVINASVAGVVNEALNNECIEEVYGSLNGVVGLLNEDFVDLASESQQAIRGLRYTPGAALGTCRTKLKKDSDTARVIEVLKAHNIRYYFHIGDADSQETAVKISEAAAAAGYELRVIGIPKTVENDLPATDHCPGYGSAVKFIASTVKELSLDAESAGQGDIVTIIEVMGRNTGWLAAGASLAKRRDMPNDPPHLTYLPEVPFTNEKFVEDVRRILKREKHCVVVAGEGLVDKDGNYVSVEGANETQLGGVGEFMKDLVESQIGAKARVARFGVAQRAAAHLSSKTDSDEAYLVGQAAVKAAVNGETDVLVTLVRGDGDNYTCETGLTALAEVVGNLKKLPAEWVNEDGVSLNFQFFRYATPLIQGEVTIPYDNGLPSFARLGKQPVDRTLGAYQA